MGLFGRIKKDIQVIFERDPRQKSVAEVIFCYPGFMPSSCIELPTGSIKGDVLIPRMISQFSRFLTGIEIHPGAKIGRDCLSTTVPE